jgi:tripartite motif-containing protein 2/3
MSSTLVETVSINYEDFNESFLTCGTCLCMYDGQEHTPKLLPCSHTVCLECLIRIVATFARDSQFRCPMCRELINIPRGGVQALPPSFLVNQLLDLMASQRREVIPKCSTHATQELLFCETCDSVFCTVCTGGSHKPGDQQQTGVAVGGGSGNSTADHTVIPFSIAIKRMSEILIYKANECTSKLNSASEQVTAEIHRLDHNADQSFDHVNTLFQEVVSCVERRREEVLAEVKHKKDEKKKVLEEQLKLINAEKSQVDKDVQAMKHQVEVRNITKKISQLNMKLDAVNQLAEPRENSYILFQRSNKSFDDVVARTLKDVGQIKTSKTFPSLCRVTMETSIASLESTARVQTIDYHGQIQEFGGDPVTAEVVNDKGDHVTTTLKDNGDGTYDVNFTPSCSGTYCLKVKIFDRPIKDCPLFFDVTEHNSPLLSFGSKGVKDKGFVQPCSLTLNSRDLVYVVDTGNSRIKVLSTNLDFQSHVLNQSLEGRSVTGVCLGSSADTLITVNWRTKTVTEISMDGVTIGAFSHDDFIEPIAVAINADGDMLVADNGVGSIMVFESCGKLKKKIGKKGTKKGDFKEMSSLCISPLNGDIIVADTRIIVFNSDGEFCRELGGASAMLPNSSSGRESASGGGATAGAARGRYSGVAVDDEGTILAARMEKTRSYIQVFNADGSLYSVIDSHGSKLKRPTGVAVSGKSDRHAYVVDIGHDCIRKYRYK